MSNAGKKDGAQLARIEATGISTHTTLSEIKGELDRVKKEQEVSRTFRDKYTEPLEDVIKHKKEQERLNIQTQHDLKDIKRTLPNYILNLTELWNSSISSLGKMLLNSMQKLPFLC